ncbi:hypothetical protein K227x_34100 [Rubripirellula lacrimiformis]|uniref:Uncharacterized protein n=1 Tax=Rubripirellula lacrimiformis TaxID=1930273 RepID=A0A517ND04_9BACT|nr:hypothetical protein [Rubripirellula lacrimiformis]QDT05012.1 hypothetical protein K227x_34100 [Rubripirellula lacrimiformis]
MAWRPTHLVQAGEIDNTQLGWTMGWLQLDGINEPLRLKLAGNCHPDLAGWKFRIQRIAPDIDQDIDGEDQLDYSIMGLDQSGQVGDITADQRVKHFDLPNKEVARRLMSGEKLPFTWRNCLYLEWYSNHIGRVVIQSTELEVVRMGERAFELTEEQWVEQHQQNRREIEFFMTQLGDALENAAPDEDDE